MTFSPDGKTLGASSHDGTARLWDADTGRPIVSLVGHSNWVHGIAFSKQGLVASASADRTVRIWKPNLDWEVRTLATMQSRVHGMAFNHKGDKLVLVCDSGEVAVRDLHSGEEVINFRVSESCWKIALSPDETQIAIANVNGMINLWDPNSGEEILELPGHTDRINNLVYIPKSNLLASASHDHTVRIWDTFPWQAGTRFSAVPHNLQSLVVPMVVAGNKWIVTNSYMGHYHLEELSRFE